MTGRREINDLKLIDQPSFRMAASHRAVTKVNAEVAPKKISSGGRTRKHRVKATQNVAGWLKRQFCSGGVESDSTVTRTCRATGETLLIPS
jgi:hypothetical protein